VQCGIVQRQAMDRRPEIQHVPLDSSIHLEALKRGFPQMDREGSVPVGRVAVHGAGTTALVATAAELSQQTQMLKHLLHGDLLTQEGEVGFFAYPLEKVSSRPCSILADGAEGVPSRHLVCSIDWTSGLCPAELTRPEPAGAAA
jgi:hypothetical protein